MVRVLDNIEDNYLYFLELDLQSILLASIMKNSEDFYVFDSALYDRIIKSIINNTLPILH
jgi:hypothetical protein